MGRRCTIQRALVLEAVRELRRHVTAEEVYNTIIKKYPNISRGAVYRNLNVLSESGEIRKVEMPSAADRFDHQCHNHYHAICMKCGEVFDVEMEFIADLEKNIKETHRFQFTGHDIIFKGICHECNK